MPKQRSHSIVNPLKMTCQKGAKIWCANIITYWNLGKLLIDKFHKMSRNFIPKYSTFQKLWNFFLQGRADAETTKLFATTFPETCKKMILGKGFFIKIVSEEPELHHFFFNFLKVFFNYWQICDKTNTKIYWNGHTV